MKISTTVQLKGWLFEVYSRSSNIEAYNNINKHTMSYRDKVSQGISEEGYELRDRGLQLEEDIRIWHTLRNSWNKVGNINMFQPYTYSCIYDIFPTTLHY